MSLTIKAPDATHDLKPRIVVIGVGGAGGNAVNNMIRSNLEGVEFVVANTDAQALNHAEADRKIQLGVNRTQGLGAGAQPMIGREAAEESMPEVLEHLQGANMVFITAGMGGGTGTGAAPVIAQAARDSGLLTVGVVTKPFQFEGTHRMRAADAGIEDLQQFVDTLIIIPNQNLFRVANEKTTFADAFKMADDVLYSGVRGVTDLMVMPGLINLDFADIRTVMSEMGKAMMGTGESSGEDRATAAAESAISNPLLEDASMRGARGVLINITGGSDMTLFEVDEAANRIRQEVDAEANIIFGSTFDENLEGLMRVSVVATGIEAEGVANSPSQFSGLAPLRPRRLEPSPEPVAAAEPEVASEPVAEIAELEDDFVQTDLEDAVAEAMDDDLTMAPPMAEPMQMEPAPISESPISNSMPEPQRAELFEEPAGEPETVTEVRTEAPPEPVRPKDAFIPTRPVQAPEQNREPLNRPNDAFKEAEMVNAGGVSSAATAKGSTKGRPSLFSRMTGIGLNPKGSAPEATAAEVSAPEQPVAQAVPQPAPQAPAKAAEPTMPNVRPLPPKPAEPEAARPAPEQAEFAVPSNASAVPAQPETDLAPSRADEEMLEIPAFLRRQAN